MLFKNYFQISKRLAGIVYVYSTGWVTKSQKENTLDYTVHGRIIMSVMLLRMLTFGIKICCAAYRAYKPKELPPKQKKIESDDGEAVSENP